MDRGYADSIGDINPGEGEFDGFVYVDATFLKPVDNLHQKISNCCCIMISSSLPQGSNQAKRLDVQVSQGI